MADCPDSGASGLCERLVLVDCQFYRGSAPHVRRKRSLRPSGKPSLSLNFTALELVQDLAVDPSQQPGPDNPFRQVLINTHSPGVVQLLSPDDVLFADTTTRRTEDGRLTHGLRLRPLDGTWRVTDGRRDYVTKADILPYLTTPPGAQITLDLGAA